MPTPTPPGLTVITISSLAQPTALVRCLMETLVRCEPNDLQIPMNRQLPVWSLSTGPSTLLEDMPTCTVGNKKAGEKIKTRKHVQISDRPGFDYTCDEGFQHLSEVLPDHDRRICISLHQDVNGVLPPHFIEGLRRIQTFAEEDKKYVMLILTFKDAKQAALIERHVANFIEVLPCEPDPGFVLAFSIRCTNLSNVHALGVGYAMAQIRISKKDPAYFISMERFLSPNVVDRVIAYLRTESVSLAQIGKVVNLNKSTVQRRLTALPSHWKPTPNENWKEKFSSQFDFEVEDED